MLAQFGDHAGFIAASYAAFFVVLAALVMWVRLDAKTQARRLEDLEKRGVTRRAATEERE